VGGREGVSGELLQHRHLHSSSSNITRVATKIIRPFQNKVFRRLPVLSDIRDEPGCNYNFSSWQA
jgi:hypothetical protein